jgi:putative glutamine amidotransferase
MFLLPRPLIGVTGRRFPAPGIYPGSETALADVSIDAFFQPYASRLSELGADTVFLPRESSPEALVVRLDGLILAGGLDVDPSLYGGEVTAESTLLDRAQDEFDLTVARVALDRTVPVLGTCRGHEVLNVALGGTLADHGRSAHNVRDQPASAPAHIVRFLPGSRLHRLYGAEAEVNSLHHQAIARVAEGAVVTARADDGIIEAIELQTQPAVGVQWHPEFHTSVDPILGWLVDAAAEHAERARSVVG